MLYNSTQNAKEVVSAAQAIAQGISKDGGLFVPQEFPKYDENTFKALLKTDYKGRAKKVFSDFLSDFTEEEISDCVEKAYTAQKFGGENPAPISYCNLDGTTLNILELWHGPTCAFKDMALQILPHLLTKSLKKKYDGKTVKYLAQVCQTPQAGKGAFVPGRFAMTCCVQDIQFVGMPCKYDDYKSLEQRSWITITAKINVKYHPIYKGQTPDSTGPVLTAISVEPGEKPAQDVVMFS